MLSVCKRSQPPERTPYPYTLTRLPIGSDLCELKGEHYLVAVDYFSCYPEVIKLTTTNLCHSHLSTEVYILLVWIPEVVRSDN